jgi:hypothetical protein
LGNLFRAFSSLVHEILGICAPPEVFGGRADSHHSLRHDGTMAERCEETVYKTRVWTVSDPLEWAERVALGLPAASEPDRRGLGPGMREKLREPTGHDLMCLVQDGVGRVAG